MLVSNFSSKDKRVSQLLLSGLKLTKNIKLLSALNHGPKGGILLDFGYILNILFIILVLAAHGYETSTTNQTNQIYSLSSKDNLKI